MITKYSIIPILLIIFFIAFNSNLTAESKTETKQQSGSDAKVQKIYILNLFVSFNFG